MANLIATAKVKLQSDEVIVRSVHFFSSGKWRVKSQSEKIATFEGRPPIPWFLILLTFIAFLCFIVPGIIMYIFVIRKVSAKQINGGSEVDVNYPKQARKIVNRFLESLPSLEAVSSVGKDQRQTAAQPV